MSSQPSASFTPEQLSDLDKFAERNRLADEHAELIAAIPPLLERSVIYLVATAMAATLAILYFGKADVIVEAKGEILPEGNVMTLQSPQGGVVLRVFARAGDHLAAGAPVAEVDVSERGLNLAQLRRKLAVDGSQLAVHKATLERLDRVLADPRSVLTARDAGSAIGNGAYQALNALENAQIRLEAAHQDESLLPEKKRQVQQEHEVTQQRLAMQQRMRTDNQREVGAEEQALGRKREQLLAVRKLAENKLLSLVELNTEEERYRAAETSLAGARQRLDQLEVDISNTQLKLAELVTRVQTIDNENQAALRSARAQHDQALVNLRQERESSRLQIRSLESEMEQTSGQIGLGEHRLDLATIRMPAAGTLAEIKVRNAGEIIGEGAPIATIVPKGAALMVEATVQDKDIGFVRQGIEARVKVDAFPFEQFGSARARVVKVLPAFGEKTGFVVQLSLLEDRLTADGSIHYLFPGLSVQADLITREQRLLESLLNGGASGAAPAP
jgi:HlyD family secretion protein